MANNKPVILSWIVTSGQVPGEVVHGYLDIVRIQIVFGIQIKVNNMVAEFGHESLTGGRAAGIRRTHVCWVDTKDVADGHLIVNDLALALGVGNQAEVLVTPCMRSYLMAGGIHALNHSCPRFSRVIDLALAEIISGNKKCARRVVLIEDIEYMAGVNVGSIIKSQSNCTRNRASVDSSPTIEDLRGSGLGTSISRRGCSWRTFVRIAPSSVVDLAVRGCTIVLG